MLKRQGGHFRNQQQQTCKGDNRKNIYYTGEENGNPMITFPYTKSAIKGTVATFDDIVHKILRKEFNHCSDNPQTCKNCAFRFYCQNK